MFSAQTFAVTVKNADGAPVDKSDQIEMKLPPYADHERIKKCVTT